MRSDHKNGSPENASAIKQVLLGGAICVVIALTAATLDWGNQSAARRERDNALPSARCGTEIACAEKSLQAQVRDASISEASLTVSTLQFALSLVGAFGVALTVYYARAAYIASQNTADAAYASLRHTEDATYRQLRPYVFWSGKPDRKPITHDGLATLIVKNWGQTPARNITRCSALKFDNPIGSTRNIEIFGQPVGVFDLAPGAHFEYQIFMSALTQQQFDLIKEGKAQYIAKLQIEYDVVDSVRDRHEIAVVITKQSLDAGFLPLWRPLDPGE